MAFITQEQHRCRMAFQVVSVKRPPVAVATLTRTGNDLAFLRPAEGTHRPHGREKYRLLPEGRGVCLGGDGGAPAE